ncbi:MAG: preprotein translocase subunit YajC [Myxococcales bacterium]|nr:preprotein translocase subunit YajC [Myxococcales bacterium]
MGLMFLVFYFLLIRPQQKKAREHREMLSNLKRGDRIITNGGLVGRISGITEKYVTLEIAEKVRVRALRSHVLGKVGDEGEPESK